MAEEEVIVKNAPMGPATERMIFSHNRYFENV